MSATTATVRDRAAVRAPRPDPSPAVRPQLRVITGSPRAQRRRTRLVTLGILTLGAALLFGLVGMHVLLTEGQFQLASLQHQADDAQAQYIRLRLQVAQLESPARIVADAQERLGMVAPSSLSYLTPAPSSRTAPSAPAHAATRTPPDTTRGWAQAKPALVRHR